MAVVLQHLAADYGTVETCHVALRVEPEVCRGQPVDGSKISPLEVVGREDTGPAHGFDKRGSPDHTSGVDLGICRNRLCKFRGAGAQRFFIFHWDRTCPSDGYSLQVLGAHNGSASAPAGDSGPPGVAVLVYSDIGDSYLVFACRAYYRHVRLRIRLGPDGIDGFSYSLAPVCLSVAYFDAAVVDPKIYRLGRLAGNGYHVITGFSEGMAEMSSYVAVHEDSCVWGLCDYREPAGSGERRSSKRAGQKK